MRECKYRKSGSIFIIWVNWDKGMRLGFVDCSISIIIE